MLDFCLKRGQKPIFSSSLDHFHFTFEQDSTNAKIIYEEINSEKTTLESFSSIFISDFEKHILYILNSTFVYGEHFLVLNSI